MKLTFAIIKNLSLFTALALLFIVTFPLRLSAQSGADYSFLVAGHAYGAHAGTNIGLHPPLLKKLAEVQDTALLGLFLTGDIVNQSTTASWSKVETELATLEIQSFYVMGNHDNNTLGHQIFKQKHGGDYYAFKQGSDLFIVLNSTESDRSISPVQLQFLENTLNNSDGIWNRAFIFFHEVIWNSHEKYKLVRSNSRSRYQQLRNISNFWTAVFPKLNAMPTKKFFLFAGDVGGNPDAIAASYDKWNNVTLISSGMGEVKDENFLKVNVLADTVTFSLIPLNDSIRMKSVPWYNIPEKPDTIEGPVLVNRMQNDIEYKVLPIWNTTGYRWNLSAGMFGTSDSASVLLDFDSQFYSGEITVRAVNDGFGESEPAMLKVFSGDTTFAIDNKIDFSFGVIQNTENFMLVVNSDKVQEAQIRIISLSGNVIHAEKFMLNPGFNTKSINKNLHEKGLFIAEIRTAHHRTSGKIVLK